MVATIYPLLTRYRYGFIRVKELSMGSSKQLVYEHPFFLEDRPDLLNRIVRRKASVPVHHCLHFA